MNYPNELINNLQKLLDHKNGLRQKLQAVGVTVPEGASLEDMVALISAGGSGGGDVQTTVTASKLFNGITAYNSDGKLIVGTALATTTDAGLYDVRRGKTFYDHTGTLRTGLQEITDPEDVEAMQNQIEDLTAAAAAMDAKLQQVEITPECVLAPYTAIGADGELFQGVAQKSELLTVTGEWTKKITSSGVTITFPFSVTDGYIYIIAAQETHWTSGGTSITHRFVYIFKDGEVLNSQVYTAMSGSNTLSGSMNQSTGVFTVTLTGGSYKTDAKPAVTHLFAYVIK